MNMSRQYIRAGMMLLAALIIVQSVQADPDNPDYPTDDSGEPGGESVQLTSTLPRYVKSWNAGSGVGLIRDGQNTYARLQVKDDTIGTSLKSSYILLDSNALYTFSNALFSDTDGFEVSIETYYPNLSLADTKSSIFEGEYDGFTVLSDMPKLFVSGEEEFYARLVYQISSGSEAKAGVDNVTLKKVTMDDLPQAQDIEGFYPSSCCPADQCWNGTHCQDPSDPSLPPIFGTSPDEKGYRCVLDADGYADWRILEPMNNWDWSEEGVCTSSNECFISDSLGEYLVNNTVLVSGLRCLSAGSFIGDHYCVEDENGFGLWTSRTAIVAGYLKNVTKDKKFSLYCDTPSYAIVDDKTAVLNDGTFNSFCSLRYYDNRVERRIIGTSINKSIASLEVLNSYLAQLLGGQATVECADAYGSQEGFEECTTSSGSLFYHNSSALVIFTPQEITLLKNSITSEVSFWERIRDFIVHPFESVFSWFDEENKMELPQDFDALYMARAGDKNLTAYARERGGQDSKSGISAQYSGIAHPQALCYAVNIGFRQYFPLENPFLCSNSSTQANVSAEDMSSLYFRKARDETWQSLTSRTRLKESQDQ